MEQTNFTKNMKEQIRKMSWVFLMMLVLASACSKTTVIVNKDSKKVPPGQMKKATGSKSAKNYAPGQQKKKGKH
jgi:hypothetical protein